MTAVLDISVTMVSVGVVRDEETGEVSVAAVDEFQNMGVEDDGKYVEIPEHPAITVTVDAQLLPHTVTVVVTVLASIF